MAKIAELASGILSSVYERTVRSKIQPYSQTIRDLNPEDIAYLVTNGKSVMELPLAPEHLALLKGAFSVDASFAARLAQDINPRLAELIRSPKGRAWWERQRRRVTIP